MKAALDALSNYPTEEEAEAVLQACGTSGKEVVNEFIERLLRENLELKNKLAAAATAAPEQSEELEYVVIDGERRRVIPCTDGRPDCEVLHTEPIANEGAR